MTNSENLMLVDVLKDLVRDDSLTAKDIDVMERETSSYASKLWDEICVALEPEQKSKLAAELKKVHENLQAIYAARADLYAKN